MDVNGQPIQKSFQMIVKGNLFHVKSDLEDNIRILFLVPVIFHAESIQYIALGDTAIVKCHVQANPVAEISWFKGPEKLRIGKSILIIEQSFQSAFVD